MGVGFLGIIEKVMILPWVSPGFSRYAPYAYYTMAQCVHCYLPSRLIRGFPGNLNSTIVKESKLRGSVSNQNGATTPVYSISRQFKLIFSYLDLCYLPGFLPSITCFRNQPVLANHPFMVDKLFLSAFKISSFHACILP